jgi:CheY-like chemotaxis protein
MPHKLLLADDSVTIQRVIELTFADEDVQVIAVGNGQQAIDRAQRDRPDIVLADVGMPERDGYEVAAFIKGNPTLAHVPVVLLTGAFEPIDETRARAVGCDGVLVKPFEPQMVISRVKDLLAGRRPAGLWGSGPSAQGPVRPPAGDLDLRSPSQGSASDPLEA